jgi:hypothetical protein
MCSRGFLYSSCWPNPELDLEPDARFGSAKVQTKVWNQTFTPLAKLSGAFFFYFPYSSIGM